MVDKATVRCERNRKRIFHEIRDDGIFINVLSPKEIWHHFDYNHINAGIYFSVHSALSNKHGINAKCNL